MKIKVWFLLGDHSAVNSPAKRNACDIAYQQLDLLSLPAVKKIKSFYYFTEISIITMATNLWPGEHHKIMWQEKATQANATQTGEQFQKHSSAWKYSFFGKLDSGNLQVHFARKRRWSDFNDVYRPQARPRISAQARLCSSAGPKTFLLGQLMYWGYFAHKND